MLDRLAGRVPAAADVTEHLVRRLAAVVALGQQAMQRLAGDLGDRIPHRDFDRADTDRAFAVTAGLLVAHHDGEDFFRREIIAGLVEERARLGVEDARNKPRAHLRAAGIASGRVESEAADRLTVALDVGHHRDHRGGHFGKIDARIGERGVQRNAGLADIDDAHAFNSDLHVRECSLSPCGRGWRASR